MLLQLERKVAEQQIEIQELRLMLFWKDHSIDRLSEAMAAANARFTKCRCFSCFNTDRADYAGTCLVFRKGECKFATFFDECMAHCGLVVVRETKDSKIKYGFKHQMYGYNLVARVDCHFVERKILSNYDVVQGGPDALKQRWKSFSFGKRIWGAKREDDPELLKLTKLMDTLRDASRDVLEDGSDDEAITAMGSASSQFFDDVLLEDGDKFNTTDDDHMCSDFIDDSSDDEIK